MSLAAVWSHHPIDLQLDRHLARASRNNPIRFDRIRSSASCSPSSVSFQRTRHERAASAASAAHGASPAFGLELSCRVGPCPPFTAPILFLSFSVHCRTFTKPSPSWSSLMSRGMCASSSSLLPALEVKILKPSWWDVQGLRLHDGPSSPAALQRRIYQGRQTGAARREIRGNLRPCGLMVGWL